VRGTLIVAEMAVALVLLVSAGLLLRSAYLLQRVEPGFDPNNVTMMRVALPPFGTTAGSRADGIRADSGAGSWIAWHRRVAAAGTRVPMWAAASTSVFASMGVRSIQRTC
jgi:hypothetical protein